ncbi:MAG: DNA methyltransferase [Thermoflexales bacterium]|nr:DNA methyltransferase [Thermoflexales bacterium]MCS7325208.1 DNA methyltransferase [Thermoflexales bacterium]MCX7939992.1 DNA methyltransferase [Thermoflexales bacterium]MDW8053366.1 DNA methyltransferase [Anaerolineae bacterium]MDW8292019.1 DNA methyltransferase [Anaerolineae bacterium]
MPLPRAIVLEGDCLQQMAKLQVQGINFALTFLDPPFNQGKEYAYFSDDLPEEEYWGWMEQVCRAAHQLTLEGGAIYFMQREKNAEHVLRVLRETGWTLQNVIIWVKRTSAVPNEWRFGKQYQIIAFATKGFKPRVFHRLRIDAPLRPEYRYPRENGMYVTDVWDDIRELTSGYFAGEEALRDARGNRLHKQQSPVALLARILLSSTLPGDWVLDPFAGTGTTAVVAQQLGRHSVSIEIDPENVACICQRLSARREADSIAVLKHYYRFTPNLEQVWGETDFPPPVPVPSAQFTLFDSGE